MQIIKFYIPSLFVTLITLFISNNIKTSISYIVILLGISLLFLINIKNENIKNFLKLIKESYYEKTKISWSKREDNITNSFKILTIIISFIVIIIFYDIIIKNILNLFIS